MKLYEVNLAIEQIIERSVDPETGEIDDAVLGELTELQEQKSDILQWIAKKVLNVRADIGSLKAEETRLKDRRLRLEQLENRLIGILSRECQGQKTDLGVATISFRKTTRVDVVNLPDCLKWLKGNFHDDAIKVTEEVSKTKLKELLKDNEIPGAVEVTYQSASLR